MPDRPTAVPADAWWDAAENEWVLGARNVAGELEGLVRYWRPDGSLVSESEHVAGKPHGVSSRFHESGEVSQRAHYDRGELSGTRSWFHTDGVTTEKMHAGNMSKLIWRAEVDYTKNTATAFRYFDREGRAVGMDGTVLPQRPAGVPATALLDKSGEWVDGTWTETGAQIGRSRRWNAAGVLVGDDLHTAEQLVAIGFRAADGSRRVQFTLAKDGTARTLVGDAAAWRRDGSQCVRATFGAASVIEHLDRTGAVVRSTEYAALAAGAQAGSATAEDALVLDAIADGDASALEVAASLSPAGMARAFALGWGGDDERDARAARLARKLVRAIAPPSLAALLRNHALDRIARLQTASRLAAVVSALARDPAIDEPALLAALIAGGGPDPSLAFGTPDQMAAYLAAKIKDRNLNLPHMGLTALPDVIGRFHDLQRINLSSNRLTTLPATICDVFRLWTLELTGNPITSLPRELGWLPDLRTLHLAKCSLSSVPPVVWELAELQSLGLGDNALTDLPDAIGDLPDLHTLWLHGNPLRDLPRGMARLSSLSFLHLGDLPLAEPPAVVADLHGLESLWIASRSLERLPPEIVKLPKLRRLMLWYSNVKQIPDELYEAKNLVELRIKNNPLPDGTIEKLQEALPGCAIY